MNLKQFFESEEKLAIHCDTEEKAKMLCDKFDEMGEMWCSGGRYRENDYSHFLTETCYANNRKYGGIAWYEDDGIPIIPFDEIDDFKYEEIHIIVRGNETHAIHKKGGKVVDRSIAKCNPHDTFDFGTGARIAFNRLGINKEPAEECAFEDDFAPHLKRCSTGDCFGILGEKADFTALFGEELHVGDVVEVYYKPLKIVNGAAFIVKYQNDCFVMGYGCASFNCGNSENRQIRKVKPYEDLKHGEVIDGIRVVKERE